MNRTMESDNVTVKSAESTVQAGCLPLSGPLPSPRWMRLSSPRFDVALVVIALTGALLATPPPRAVAESSRVVGGSPPVAAESSRVVGGSPVGVGGLGVVVGSSVVYDEYSDRAALLALFDSAGGPDWTSKANWGSYKALTTWSGVTVNSDGRVTRLNLSYRNLIGGLPKELGNLTELEYLDLRSNRLAGGLPKELGNLTELERLDLRYNRFTGGLPKELGGLAELDYLYLSDNRFTGGLPKELGNLAELDVLYLSDNKFTGGLPKELGDLTELDYLYLDGNCFTGSLPWELSKLTSLDGLWLDGNCLSGKVPTAVTHSNKSYDLRVDSPGLCRDASLTRYQWTTALSACPGTAGVPGVVSVPVLTFNDAGTTLRVDWTTPAGNGAAITGYDVEYRTVAATGWTSVSHTSAVTTAEVSGLTSGVLYEVRVRASNSVGNGGWSATAVQHSAPDDRTALMALYNQTNGPHWTNKAGWGSYKALNSWSGVTTDDDGRVTRLDLNGRNLTGSLPAAVGDLTGLEYLDLSGNRLSGSLPGRVGDLTGLEELYLDDNHLTGNLPSRLGRLTNLRRLYLDDNHLTGALPNTIGGLTRLERLWLHDNELTGAIPTTIGGLTRLEYLYLHDNHLTGAVPTTIGGLTSLKWLWLDGNCLTGTPPAQLSALVSLTGLRLAGNCLTGALPDTLGALKTTLSLTVDSPALCRPATLHTTPWKNLLDLCPNPATVPGVPTGITATPTPTPTGISMGITWDTPAGNGAAVTGYDINYRTTTATGWTSLSHTSAVTAADINAVTAGVSYQIRVRARNNIGTSDWSATIVQRSTPDDRTALMTLYNATNGPDWTTNNYGWGSYHALNSWSGVTTDDDGRVTRLNLSNRNLSGSIPKEIAHLTELTELHLNGNRLTGAIPKEIGHLTRLTELHLNDNQLTGSIPTTIDGLVGLTELHLNDNELTDAIPTTIGGLVGLTSLDLSDNQLTDSIPGTIDQLVGLTSLHLDGNAVTGAVPATVTNLTKITQTSQVKIDTPAVCRPSTMNALPWKTVLDACPGTATTPAAPSGIAATPAGTSIHITWATPAGNGAAITAHELRYRPNNTTTWTTHTPTKPKTTNTTIGGLTPGTTYQTQIRATNQAGTSGWSTLTTTTTTTADRAALTALYNHTNGPHWNPSCATNWNTNKPLKDWHGTTTSNGRITQLNLNNCALTGTIPTQIGDLTSLTNLNLTGNNLTGKIPATIGQLTLLTTLQLQSNTTTNTYGGRNKLTNIPNTIKNLTALTTLNLADNQITTIPTTIGQLPSLTTLNLTGNQITGTIPIQLGGPTTLKHLYLNNNKLTGTIPPELSGLTSLTNLHLNDNQLTGTIPTQLGGLTRLTQLHLHDNGLTGPLPDNLKNLTSLTGSNFKVDSPGICRPHTIPKWSHITTCPATPTKPDTPKAPAATPNPNHNNGTTLEIAWTPPASNGDPITAYQIQHRPAPTTKTPNPAWTTTNITPNTTTPATTHTITGLKTNTTYHIRIRATNNTGTSPWSPTTPETTTPNPRAVLTALHNQTNGTKWTTNCKNNWNTNKPLNQWASTNTNNTGRIRTNNNGRITHLNLLRCRLTGKIPDTIGQLTHLTHLNLSHNNLTGAIPDTIGNPTRLTYLYLSFNQLTGAIPATLGNLTKLYFLYLSDNQLTGAIPATLGNLTKLTNLNLYDNQLTGTIPTTLGNLTNLTSLNLRDNQLTGTIPNTLGNLTNLYLYDNQLTGTIPDTLGNLNYLYLRGNGLSGPVPYALRNITDLRVDSPGVCRPATNTKHTNITLCPATAAAPGTPDAPTVTPNPNHSSGTTLEIVWTPPASNGDPITGYEIQHRQAPTTKTPNRAWTDTTITPNNTTPATTYTITGLKTNTVYHVRIRATNNTGTSPWSPTTPETTTPNPRAVITALYNKTNGPHWTLSCKNNWNTNKPLSNWAGTTLQWNPNIGGYQNLRRIGTDSNGRITSLYLTRCGLTGEIPEEIGQLTHLTTLNLSENNLTGAIPATLGNLTQLTNLYLQSRTSTTSGYGGRNRLTSIPATIGNLTNLQHLYLYDNQITGAIPATLGNLTNLQHLYLYDNQLTGAIPATLGNLTQLTNLYLYDNQLTGAIPATLGNLTNLQHLYLYDNQLTGAIPATLANINYLYVGGNGLSGPLPDTFKNYQGYLSGDFPALCYPVAWNKTSVRNCPGTVGVPGVPGAAVVTAERLSAKRSGTTLKVDWEPPASNGDIITGYQIQHREAPSGAWTTTTTITPNATTPSTTYTITGLKTGTVYHVRIRAVNSTGSGGWSPITPETTTPDPKAALLALYNNTNGPNWINNCSDRWDTHHDLEYWNGVNIDSNGRITTLILYNCELDGSVPAAIGNLTHLKTLNINNNSGLTGAIPGTLGNLTRLHTLKLHSNSLSGGIPAGISDAIGLYYLWLYGSNQKLTGPVPDTITNLTKLTHKNTSSDGSFAVHVWNDAALNSLCLPPALSTWTLYTPYVTAGLRVCNARKPEKPEPPLAIPGNQQIILTWTPPVSKDANITGYDIQYKTPADTTWDDHPHTGTTLTSTLTTANTATNTITITNNTPYHARIRAKNTAGTGPWSDASTTVTPNPAAGPPGAPAAPNAVAGDQQITLAWKPPTNNGGTPITSYDIRYRPYTTEPWCTWKYHPHTGTTTTNTITQLTNHTTYETQIRATNNAGTGPWSPATAATPGQCTYTPPGGLKTKCHQITGTT